MLRNVTRALRGAAVAVTTAAFAAAGAAGAAEAQEAGSGGGRYRILVPTFEVQGAQPRVGESVANDLRSLISGMATHTAVPPRDLQRTMRQHNVAQLDQITARQIAQLMNAQQLLWGQLQTGGAGLQANVTFTDIGSGDQITIENATGANPRQLAQAIFQQLESSIEGIRMAAFCNDYLASQQFERALENCDRALAVVPNSSAALYGRATALFHMDRFEEALETYQRLLAVDETHQDGLLGAGLTASRLDRGQEALGFYQRYLELNPGELTVRMAVAGQIVEAGDVVSAFRVLQPGIEQGTDNLDFQQYLAGVATQAGIRTSEQQNAEGAREFFEVALAAYDRVFAARGDSLDAGDVRRAVAVNLELGRTQEALRLAEMGTQRFADDADMWAQYASVLNRSARHADEVRALTRVEQLNAEYENLYIRRALANQKAGNRQAALADLNRAATGNRELVGQAIYGMAADELRRERWAEAANLLEMAHGYASGSLRSDISFFWGLALYRQGEAIAKSNTQGRPDPARRALGFFQQALPRLQASNNPQAGQVLSAARQYIQNQEAIIEAARGR